MIETGKKQHLARLDVVRGLAICMVLSYHWFGKVVGGGVLPWRGLWLDYSSPLGPGFFRFYPFAFGFIGVPVFFVLSGFVIHFSTLSARAAKGETLDTVAFFWRRFWRICPVYLVAVAAFTVESLRHIPFSTAAFDMGTHLLFIHNFFERTFFSLNRSFWSLATEMQFYLLYPLFLLMRRRAGMEGTLWILGGVSVVSWLIAAVMQDWSAPRLDWVFWYSTPALWINWAFGAWIAERYCEKKPPLLTRATLFAATIGLTATFLLLYHFKPMHRLTFVPCSLLTALWIDRYVRNQNPLAVIERLLIPVGLVSYSLYVWHQPLIEPLFRRARAFLSSLGWGGSTAEMTLGLAVGFLLLLAFASLSYITIERGGNAFGRWLWGRRRRPLASADAPSAPAS